MNTPVNKAPKCKVKPFSHKKCPAETDVKIVQIQTHVSDRSNVQIEAITQDNDGYEHNRKKIMSPK